MLTAQQIAALRDAAYQITDPIIDYLLQDIARRIAEAGQLTSTAAYQVWRVQQLGKSQREVEMELRKLLQMSRKQIRKILHQSAQSGYSLDINRFPTSAAIPFEKNAVLQQIVSSAVELAEDDFTNLTQTLGMVDPYGNALPLQDVYRSCTDFAFKQVVTGAASYTQAIREATRNLASKGVRVIDYESGVHTSLEAAVRRNIMGGLGLMQEQVSQTVHDQLGCDGWEITAHANSAPDHEPIQGRQYPDAAYQVLNNSLRRRIGTLNCGHAAFPIILGLNQPQYTPEELEKFRADNEKGVTVDGVHYTGYQATQMQRSLERAIRAQKQKVMVDKATEDKEKLAEDQTRLTILRQRYAEFSKAAGLRTQEERTEVAGFGEKSTPRQNSPSSAPKLPEAGTSPRRGMPADSSPPDTQSEAISVRVEQPVVNQGTEGRENVTEEYIRTATPGQGEIIFEDGYVAKRHQGEIKMAHWLRDTFGGDITLLKEAEKDSEKRPDYMWRNALWELKGAHSINGADKRFQYAIKQIKDKPGGFILDLLEDMDMEALERQLTRRFYRNESEINALDLMILSKGKLLKILRYKK